MVIGSNTSGTLLEEGLRGAGAHLFNAQGERFMERYAPDVKERATRDVVSRCSFMEIMAGRGTPNGGVYIDASVMGPEFVEKNFPGMVERCRDYGFDLARDTRVEISPTAHFFMGGAVDRPRPATPTSKACMPPGKTPAESTERTVWGETALPTPRSSAGLAGDSMSERCGRAGSCFPSMRARCGDHQKAEAPLGREGIDLYPLRDQMRLSNWEKLGIIREEKRSARRAEGHPGAEGTRSPGWGFPEAGPTTSSGTTG